MSSGCEANQKPYGTFLASDVRKLLFVTREEQEVTGKAVNAVVQALCRGFHPQKVYMGGSYKKGTSLRGSYDIDLVVFMSDFDHNAMEAYRSRAVVALNQAQIKFSKSGQTPYCIKIDFQTGEAIKSILHFDILFSGDPRRKRQGTLERYYSAGEAPENDEMVVRALDRHKGLLELILLCKLWRSRQNFQTYGVTSFYVELVCIKVFEESQGERQELQSLFRKALKMLSAGCPMQKSNGTVVVDEAARSECGRCAAATLKDMGPEFLYLAPSQIRFAQKSVGSKFRDGRTLEETACQLARADMEKRDVEMIRIVRHDDGNLYSMDNRRLAVFRLLEMSGKTKIVKARLVSKDDGEWKFKFDTACSGQSVEVRGTSYIVGVNRQSTTFPLEKLLGSKADGSTAQLPLDEESDEDLAPAAKRRKIDEFNHATEATFEKEAFAAGAFRLVHRGKYTKGMRAGEACVVKSFKTGSVFENSFFAADVQIVDKAAEIIDLFNKKMHGKTGYRIFLNRPEVWSQLTGEQQKIGQKMLVEPMIDGTFFSFNSNSGYVSEGVGSKVMQALSHFSYEVSNAEVILCDLQGGMSGNEFVLTDPVVLSQKKQYGPTDLGADGISNFMAHHTCTCLCEASWAKPVAAKKCLPVVKGTTFR